MGEKSCKGCKFLYGDGSGYSNYTWLETYVCCALGLNPALIKDAEQPFGWDPTEGEDKWAPTMSGRCEKYAPGVWVLLDPDREDHPSTQSTDAEQIAAILAADGRSPTP